MDSVVEIKNLTKVFKDFWGRPKVKAVNDISFGLKKGEVLGLLGPNGSGKSTTIKMILGLLFPSSGSISVLGQLPGSVDAKRKIGFLPEETYLYPYLSAREILDFFGKLHGLDLITRQSRIEQLIELVDVKHAAGRKIGEFSKGMARRIGLAQTLINDPEFVILDEPTSGLDPIGRRKIKDIIIELKAKGKTVLLSSHLLAEVEDVCDRIVIMYMGDVLSSGDIRSLLEQKTMTRLTTPQLDPQTLDAVKALVEKAAGQGSVQVDHPEISLEKYFLDIISESIRSKQNGLKQ